MKKRYLSFRFPRFIYISNTRNEKTLYPYQGYMETVAFRTIFHI